MVLITDGENSKATEFPGYWGCEGPYPGCSGAPDPTELNARMLNWCEAIRNDYGIQLITIAVNFGANATSAANLLRQCAGSAENAYRIDANQLDRLLQDIAETSILKLMLRE